MTRFAAAVTVVVIAAVAVALIVLAQLPYTVADSECTAGAVLPGTNRDPPICRHGDWLRLGETAVVLTGATLTIVVVVAGSRVVCRR